MIGIFSERGFCAESERTSSPSQVSGAKTSTLGWCHVPYSLRCHSTVQTSTIKKGPHGGRFSRGHMAGFHDLLGPFLISNSAILKWTLRTPDRICLQSGKLETEAMGREQGLKVVTEVHRAVLLGVRGRFNTTNRLQREVGVSEKGNPEGWRGAITMCGCITYYASLSLSEGNTVQDPQRMLKTDVNTDT